MELTSKLAKGPRSLGIIKQNAWAATDSTLEFALSKERNGQRKASRTDDFLEGIKAFGEKRPPEFKGQ